MKKLSKNNLILFAMWAFKVNAEADLVKHGQLRRALQGLHSSLPDSISLKRAVEAMERVGLLKIKSTGYVLTDEGREEASAIYARMGYQDGMVGNTH